MPRRTGAVRAAPGWPPSARVSGRPRLTARPPQGSGDRRGLASALAGRGRCHAIRGGRGTTTARHQRAPRSGPPRSTTRLPRGSGDCRSPACAGAPDRATEVARQHAGGTPLCPAEKGGEVKNVACHLSRNNA